MNKMTFDVHIDYTMRALDVLTFDSDNTHDIEAELVVSTTFDTDDFDLLVLEKMLDFKCENCRIDIYTDSSLQSLEGSFVEQLDLLAKKLEVLKRF